MAVSTVGVMRHAEARELWKKGMRVALERLKPECVLLYGYKEIDFDFENVKFYRAEMFRKGIK